MTRDEVNLSVVSNFLGSFQGLSPVMYWLYNCFVQKGDRLIRKELTALSSLDSAVKLIDRAISYSFSSLSIPSAPTKVTVACEPVVQPLVSTVAWMSPSSVR